MWGHCIVQSKEAGLLQHWLLAGLAASEQNLTAGAIQSGAGTSKSPRPGLYISSIYSFLSVEHYTI